MNKGIVTLTGTVIRGAGYGSKLGFPTANLDRREYSLRKPKLKLGIYAGAACIVKSQKLQVKSYCYPAALILSLKDKRGLPKIEAHLLNFSGVLYGKKLQLSFIKYLRPFKVFKSEAELVSQIKRDLRAVRQSLSPLTKGVTSRSFSENYGWSGVVPTQKTASKRYPQPQARRAR